MTRLRQSIVICFLSGINSALVSGDNLFADVYKNTRGTDNSPDSTGSVETDYDLILGINRGESSPIDFEGESASPDTVYQISYTNGIGETTDTTQPVDVLPDAADTARLSDTLHFGHASCIEETEDMLAAYEDIRMELMSIDQQYLENASVENVCVKDGKISNCNFDFREYPSNLESVCNNRGGNYYKTEHSIQCHNPSTMESLYYQFDHYPSCCSSNCEQNDANNLLSGRIDSITDVMSDFLQMSCFADYDILRHANDGSSIHALENSSSSTQRSWRWTLLSALPFLIHNLV